MRRNANSGPFHSQKTTMAINFYFKVQKELLEKKKEKEALISFILTREFIFMIL